jgi:hypothetical protein
MNYNYIKNDNYRKMLKKGLEYQDFVMEFLHYQGLPLITYSSEKYQIEKGENKLGVEIKFDDNFKRTGNLFIEVEERRDENKKYINSGIFRDDNTWLYIIGDYEWAFVFFKIQLQGLRNKHKIIEIGKKTSKGFLISTEEIKKYCGLILDFKKGMKKWDF